MESFKDSKVPRKGRLYFNKICKKCGKELPLEELSKFCKNIIRYSLNNIEKEDIEQEDKESLG